MSVHTGRLPHQCAQCGRQFASRRRLADHQRGHAEGWSCHLCDKVGLETVPEYAYEDSGAFGGMARLPIFSPELLNTDILTMRAGV